MAHSLLQIAGLAVVLALFWLARTVLCKGRGFKDFFIGDNGTYSLSRLQMVAWATAIISFQVSVIIVLLFTQRNLALFELKFTEPVLWLLGLSLGSYVAVKGITVNRAAKTRVITRKEKAKVCDLVMGDNGLDFSKFQMLIWTVIALFVFIMGCNLFLSAIYKETDQETIKVYFMTQEEMEQYKLKKELPKEARNRNDLPILPTISWSFLILMGLSQGAYVGKKLVPSFRVREAQKARLEELENSLAKLTIEIKYREKELESLEPITTAEKKNKDLLQIELQSQKRDKERIKAEIEKINKAIKKEAALQTSGK
jgi:hypothetical protein